MESPAAEPCVVVIDDDPAMRLSCRQILARVGHAVETFGDGAQGLAAVARLRPGLVIVDLKMPGLSGLEVLRRLHEIDPTIVAVVITGYATIDTAVEAMKAGAYDFLPKPFAPDELRIIVSRALERRRLQLASAAAETEREVLKRRFVSFVSHQLKAPLAAVHQYLDVLRRLEGQPEVEDKRRQWIDRCLERSAEMRALIDDWLTLARIESDSLVGRRESVELAALLERVVEAHRGTAAAAGVSLTLAEGADRCTIASDPTSLGVLFENLVDNAVKYNRPGGTVTVAAAVAGGEAVVEVRDSGLGIPADALTQLFGEFFRAPTPRAEAVRGSGLGLAICRRIAGELGGTIEVESTLGEGSTFRVRLPLAVEAAAEPGVGGAAAAAPPRAPAATEHAATTEVSR